MRYPCEGRVLHNDDPRRRHKSWWLDSIDGVLQRIDTLAVHHFVQLVRQWPSRFALEITRPGVPLDLLVDLLTIRNNRACEDLNDHVLIGEIPIADQDIDQFNALLQRHIAKVLFLVPGRSFTLEIRYRLPGRTGRIAGGHAVGRPVDDVENA